MKICKGLTRITVQLPRAGIVVKFPHLYPSLAFGYFWESFFELWKTRGWRIARKIVLGNDIEVMGTVLWCFGAGIAGNWSEFIFYLKTRHGFCQPTFFSFFGLFNIQKYGQPLGDDDDKLPRFYWYELYPTLGSKAVDGHTWLDADNFIRDRGGLRIVDYGGRKTRELLIGHRFKLGTLRD